MRFTLDQPPFAGRTGRGVTVAVIDSGINLANPHIGSIAGGIAIEPDGESSDYLDRIGHGTAVAAAIREKAPAADLFAVRVFDRTLSTSADTLARAITRAAERGARLINLSLGTANPAREAILRAAAERAVALGALVVSARELEGQVWLPGSLAGVAGVLLEPACGRDELEVRLGETTRPTFAASGYPRPIPGVPPERNLSGISFAVANVTGFLARLLEEKPTAAHVDEIGKLLRSLGSD